MRVHHLNCATMRPLGARLMSGTGGVLATHRMVAHCLLIEAGDELVLVDTGLGVGDAAFPERMNQPMRAAARPEFRFDETAIRQIERRGLDPADVGHVVLTHLDADHTGGIGDFPHAKVHVHAPELAAAQRPALRDRWRYVKDQWAHRPHWVSHRTAGERWLGFDAIRLLPELEVEMLMVPLPGHSAGLAGIAVRTGDGWLLHCGDAFFHPDELRTPPSCPAGLRVVQAMMAHDDGQRRRTQERLRALARQHAGEVRLVCSHNPQLLAQAAARARETQRDRRALV